MLSLRCRPIQGKRPPILLSLDGEADQTPRFASRKVPSFLRKSTFELETTKSGHYIECQTSRSLSFFLVRPAKRAEEK